MWNHNKFIIFTLLFCRLLITSCKTLIITVISNETASELTMYINHLMSKRHYILSTRTSFFISVQEKLRACRNSKKSFLSNCFIASGSHIKVQTLKLYAYIFQVPTNMVFYIFEMMSIYQNIIRSKYFITTLIPSIAQIKQVCKF